MATKKTAFKEVIVTAIDEYMDKAFDATDAEKRAKYRNIIKELEKLLLMITELD